ncbi:amidohydrolase family protein [Acidobacteriota bacterium]
MKNKFWRVLPFLILIIFCHFVSCNTQNYDVIVLGGTIFDGSGSPGYHADIGMRDGIIQKIGNLRKSQGNRIIDAVGKFVAPGFIDIHTHSDNGIRDQRRKNALNYISQGVTTLVGGNCGGGTYNVSDYFLKLEEQGIGPNIVHLVGHGTIRQEVMGYEDRAPDKEEMEKMKSLVDRAMSEGALGLSSGLFYAPGSYAQTEELIELCKVVKKYNGIYASHLRDESNYGIGLLSAIEEAIEIGEKSGVPVQISHIKALGKPVWGLSRNAAEIIEAARGRGVSVFADQYPYNASSTSLTAAVIPRWVQAGGRLKELLSGSSQLNEIKVEIAENIERRGGPETLVIASSLNYSKWEGKSLHEISVSQKKNDVDMAIEMVLNGSASIVSFNMTDEDIEYFMAKPWVMTGSDGSLPLFGSAQPHPRSYGTFPKKIRSYVLDKQILSMEQAVRAATGLPAEMLGFSDRGLLKRGYVADIVVFDPNSIQDNATYSDPHQYSSGIISVLISGNPVIEASEYNGTLQGKPLRKGQDF